MTSVTPTSVGSRRLLRVPMAVRLTGGAALTGLVAALVLGILGMHALAHHGTPGPATAAAAAASSASVLGTSGHEAAMPRGATGASGASAEGHAHAAAHSSTAAAATGTPVDPGHGGNGMTSMSMLCAVMLAAAALTALARLVVGLVRPLLPAAFKPAAARERVLRWVRGAAPPPVWQFSVIRC